MSTTLIETLKRLADYEDANDYTKTATDLRAAAARLNELERENARKDAALAEAEFVVSATIDLFLKRGEKDAAVELIKHRTRLHFARAALAGSGEP